MWAGYETAVFRIGAMRSDSSCHEHSIDAAAVPSHAHRLLIAPTSTTYLVKLFSDLSIECALFLLTS